MIKQIFLFSLLIFSIILYQELIIKYSNYTHAKQVKNELSVMTYNIRSENLDYGRHHWKNRLPLLVYKINEAKPDIIGTQEGLFNQLKDLETALPEYKTFGYLNINDKEKHENLVIFYNKEKLEFLEGNYLWLSDTPNIELSNTWGGKFPRLLTYAIFKLKETGDEILVLNTHLDHRSNQD
jgi:endonuclease/exonuclease/phosphatase family metal-dependent hydrolase